MRGAPRSPQSTTYGSPGAVYGGSGGEHVSRSGSGQPRSPEGYWGMHPEPAGSGGGRRSGRPAAPRQRSAGGAGVYSSSRSGAAGAAASGGVDALSRPGKGTGPGSAKGAGTGSGKSSGKGSGSAKRKGAGKGGKGAGKGGKGANGKARGATGPGRKGKGRSRRRDPLWARLCVILGALIMVLSGGVMAAAKVVLGQATDGIETANLLSGDSGAGNGPGGSDISGAINLLLVGIDVREKEGSSNGARSDTIVILHIPATHDQAYLVSIPRDLRVPIPEWKDPKSGRKINGGTNKINASFDWGYEGPGDELTKRARGFGMLANTINKLSGIRFNGAAIIDFVGFEAVVRELGGVDMCVDQHAESAHLGIDKNGKIVQGWFDDSKHKLILPPGSNAKPLVHEVGCRRMSAEYALDYSRIRYGLPNTDYDRQRHQQQLLKAIAKEATSKGVLTDFGKLKRVIDAAGKAFVLDTQGVPIQDFLFTLKGVAANDLVTVKFNNGTYNSENIGGTSYEKMSDESLQMLHAVRDGRLDEFLILHPNVYDAKPT